ncbi:MAG: carbohydrate kinase [Candidatus Eremiobacteraeota bacterium]|nr:carbohydrate kinase [Candidatus Eremiobacteraeota bacterium]MCW5870096.1 carbohydrate kinase [Candidatus Eremiobacteraeota bacterium]
MRVVGVDLGSTAIKACLWELQPGRSPVPIQRASRELHLQVAQPGWAVQDPQATLQAVRELLTEMPDYQALGFSSAMHSLLPLCESGQPAGMAISWADQRSWAEAERLRKEEPHWAELSGTPLHPMAWPAKLLWWRRHEPAPAAWVGLKEWVVSQLAGLPRPPWMDRSLASATGLYATSDWSPELLQKCGVDRAQLPRVIEPDQPLPEFPVKTVLGAGDGPLSHLGTGTVRSDQACLSIGTSGALRMVCGAGAATEGGKLFRYYLAKDRWVRGGAISNGSLVLDWARGLQGLSPEALLENVAKIPAGSEGLVALPYLMGERSPIWDARARGAMVGLSVEHTQAHIARAMLEGVVFALRQVAESLPGASEIRVTGGLSRSPVWLQILADGLARPVLAMAEGEAGALGAAQLAAGFEVEPEILTRYEPLNPAAYERPYAIYRQLYPALRQVMHAP